MGKKHEQVKVKRHAGTDKDSLNQAHRPQRELQYLKWVYCMSQKY